jgi:hypothetical protein
MSQLSEPTYAREAPKNGDRHIFDISAPGNVAKPENLGLAPGARYALLVEVRPDPKNFCSISDEM